MKLGTMVNLTENVAEGFAKLKDFGLSTCQLCCWNLSLFTDEYAEIVKNACKEHGVTITALWCGWKDGAIIDAWNFIDGPQELGIVPEAYRFTRCMDLKHGSDFAKKIGVDTVATHLGFIPETPSTVEYRKVVFAVRDLAAYMKRNGQKFIFETGQETPVTLKRLIIDVEADNLGINLDPANLILYGKANPVDALDVFGEYVAGVHAKDGLYPTDGYHLGKEVKVGEGKVNFPALVKKLKELGYDGALTIEREISGEEQIKDIAETKIYLEKLINE